MANSSVELLRKYSDLIVEAEMDTEPQPTLDTEPGLEGEETGPDYDEQENDEAPEDISEDPIMELSSAIAAAISHAHEGDAHEQTVEQAIHAFMEKNNYELTPINGLTNKMGKL